MSCKYEVGTVGKRTSSTKLSTATWAQQSFNLFAINPEVVLGESNKGNVHEQPPLSCKLPPGGKTSIQSLFNSEDGENAVTMPPPSIKRQAPGGKSSVADLFCPTTDTNDVPKSSTRVFAAPGGASSIGGIFSQDAPAPPPASVRMNKANSNYSSSVFSQDPVPVKSSTRVHAAPGGHSNLFASDAPAPQAPPSIRTAKVNESHNVFNLSPEKQAPHSSYFSSKKNDSHNVLNLTPCPVQKATSRTARANEMSMEECKVFGKGRTAKANEESQEQPSTKPSNSARHAVHNKMMAGSNIFGDQRSDEAVKSSTRVMAAPGGKSSNIFA